MGMAENYKPLYELMKKMVALYQDEIVPRMRELLEKRVEVVRCKDCQWFNKKGYEEDNRQQGMPELDFGWCSILHRTMQACMFCSYGERKDNG